MYKIEVHSIDDGEDGDNKYCAILLVNDGDGNGWYNGNIVYRCDTPFEAFHSVLNSAKFHDKWE